MKEKHIQMDEVMVPHYAVHEDGKIYGFFGAFRFMSNFYPLNVGVVFEELTFPSVEHAYQAAKYPYDQRRQFVEVNAGQAKRLGQKAPNYNSKKWAKHKYEIMYALNWQKYFNNEILQEKLVMTSGCDLQERNHWGDRDWGTDENGIGENNLGKILMRVREKIIAHRQNNEF